MDIIAILTAADAAIADSQILISTVKQMIADGQAQTTADQQAALVASHARLVAAKAQFDADAQG